MLGDTPMKPGAPKESGVAVAVGAAGGGAGDGVVLRAGAERFWRTRRAAEAQPCAETALCLGLVGRPVAGVAEDRRRWAPPPTCWP